eukprot:Hpha_TRINITY_DN34586_c0_g1::TRINITY_DN34586_c0_g1_i1::g.96350::m.96350
MSNCRIIVLETEGQRPPPRGDDDDPTLLLLCAETCTFRRLAKTHVLSSDIVLEVGCSFGDTTAVLCKRARAVLAVDNSTECVQRASSVAPQARILQLDALGNPEQLVSFGAGASVLFVDIGGTRAAAALVLLLQSSLSRLRPKLCVVKCRALHAGASSDEGAQLSRLLRGEGLMGTSVPAQGGRDGDDGDGAAAAGGEGSSAATGEHNPLAAAGER